MSKLKANKTGKRSPIVVRRLVRMPGVEVIQQYRVTRKCGHFEERPISYGKALLKPLTESPCEACREAS